MPGEKKKTRFAEIVRLEKLEARDERSCLKSNNRDILKAFQSRFRRHVHGSDRVEYLLDFSAALEDPWEGRARRSSGDVAASPIRASRGLANRSGRGPPP